MAEMRLYAIGIDEAHDLHGADPADHAQLRSILATAFAPPQQATAPGLLGKLGPLLKRDPYAPVVRPGDPTRADVDAFLAGDSFDPSRIAVGWRLLETLVAAKAWGSIRLSIGPDEVDDIDFALSRGGVAAAVGLRHLFTSTTELNLLPVRGLTVGWHDHGRAVLMGEGYRTALGAFKSAEQQELVAGLVTWLDGFPHWAEVAVSLGRPVPDLLGFWVD